MPSPPNLKAKKRALDLVSEGNNRLVDIASACGYRSSASALHFMQKLVHENLIVKHDHKYYTKEQYAELQAKNLKDLAPTKPKPEPIYEGCWKGPVVEQLIYEATERRMQYWRNKFG